MLDLKRIQLMGQQVGAPMSPVCSYAAQLAYK